MNPTPLRLRIRYLPGLLAIVLLAGCMGNASAERTKMTEPTGPVVTVSPAPTVPESPSPSPITEIEHENGKPKEETTGKEPARKSKLQPEYSVAKGTVAITVDDGPTKHTPELLKVLREEKAKVTFFFLGQNAAAYPKSVSEAVYNGHGIGYHSNVHPKMTAMTFDEQLKEFDTGLNTLQKWAKQPVLLFRPPYGAYNNDTKLITEDHKMRMILWNEDPKDWSTSDPSVIARGVLGQVHSGSIIVMHDRPSTIAALPAIIDGIRKKGYQLVVL
ncbi:polysaccharide deacetylase family protein [Gorillibacterium sp. sgz5001074]|uniref:polysaccharide deacetylase family protein n=1 Tax=Gorillibacterium sp. sgz5001074 TaxID=3446695 RepID=UPI003F6751A9